MNCNKARQLFSAFLEAELKPEEATRVQAHLAQCPDCGSLFEVIKNLDRSLKNLPEVEPAPELINSLYLIPEKVGAKTKARGRKRFFSWKFWLSPAFQPVLTSVTVILMALSIIFFTSMGKSLRKSASLEIHRGYSQAQKLLVKAGILTDKVNGYRENFIASLEAKNIYRSE
ncbi:MAG: zf-HC2 domain-containing protein [Candidatus Aminicenantes bacterium]|nr:zf-HC2 domain-containing protein [Candidatus Aminicenantes bacterium]